MCIYEYVHTYIHIMYICVCDKYFANQKGNTNFNKIHNASASNRQKKFKFKIKWKTKCTLWKDLPHFALVVSSKLVFLFKFYFFSVRFIAFLYCEYFPSQSFVLSQRCSRSAVNTYTPIKLSWHLFTVYIIYVEGRRLTLIANSATIELNLLRVVLAFSFAEFFFKLCFITWLPSR